MNPLKLLSTVKQLRFEDADGKVLGRIERNVRGVCVLIGERPLDRPHYQVVVYFDERQREDRTFVPSRPQPRLEPRPASWSEPMRPTRAD